MKNGSLSGLESFGQYLKQERELRHISLEEIAEKMSVGSCFLVALEENNCDFFPEPRFVPTFLKRYALQLGLDPDQVMSRFVLQHELGLLISPSLTLACAFNPSAFLKRWCTRLPKGIIPAAISVSFFLIIGFLFLNQTPTSGKPVAASKAEQNEQFPSPRSLTLLEGTGTGWIFPGDQRPAGISRQKPQKQNLSNDSEDSSAMGLSSEPGKMKVVANWDSKRYHLPGMKYYDKVKAYHRVEFDSEEEAIQAGYYKAPR